MIRSLHLENWKTHYKTQLEFEKGTNVIVGKMGSGKSSVLDAISFALYGTFPGLNGRKVTLEETIMAKPSRQDNSSVKLEFDYAGKIYSAERIIKRNGTNEGYLREDGKLIAGPKTSDVTKKVCELLESNYDLFNRAIYSEQNQIDFFLRMTPSQRKEKLDELLGLDRYESARSNSVTLASKIKRTAEDKKKFAQEQKAKNDFGKIADYERKIAQKTSQIAEHEKLLPELFEQEKNRSAKLESLLEKEKEHRQISEKLIASKTKLEGITHQVKTAEQKTAGLSEREIAKGLQEKKDELLQTGHKSREIEGAKKDLERHIVLLKEKRAKEMSLLEQCIKQHSTTVSLDAKCPVCQKPISSHDKENLIGELNGQEALHKSEIAQIEAQIKNQAESLQNLEITQKAIESAKERLLKENFEFETLKKISAEITDKKRQAQELEAGNAELGSKLKSLDFDGKSLENARRELSGLSAKLAKEKSELSGAKELLSELEKSLKAINQAKKSIEELLEQASMLEKKSEKLSIFTSALRATQAELREVMIENINFAMQEIWPRVYPYNDLLGVKIALDEGNYEIAAKQRNGEWVRVEGILSGGERSSVAITLRIALSLVLTQNLGWIMLDEPTHNLDSSAVRELSGTLGTKLPELIDQIFIITHDKEMENAATGKLYVFEREKENDGATKVN